ncbi:MAG: hypothetical protein P8Y18_01495 [Candidatus Bathyarchaeota archaeon]
MKAYFGALIDKSISKQNSQLADKIEKEFKKKIKKTAVNKKEHNTFLFLGAEKNLEKPISIETYEKIENSISFLLQDYYNKNKTKLKKLLKEKQELRETSEIVKDFLKVIDSKLPKTFEINLKKLLSDLPNQYFEIQKNSMTMIWNLNETNETNILLSGCNNRKFTITNENVIDFEEMTDKLVIMNFFLVFLDPTLSNLRNMNQVLERLSLGLQGRHFKINDNLIYAKLHFETILMKQNME